ncbi:putative lipase ROG1 [Tanacetum coccineum]
MDICEYLLISFYISKIKPALQQEFVSKPTSLGEAFSLASITESHFEDEWLAIAIAKPNDLNTGIHVQYLEEITLHKSNTMEAIKISRVATSEEHGHQDGFYVMSADTKVLTKPWPGVSKIPFIAHSLGGLVVRYAIRRLYENSSSETKISGVQPVNFITVATLHLGSRGHRQLSLLCGLSFIERSTSQIAHWIARRSGKHLFLTVIDEGELSLLIQIVNDSKNIKLIFALGSFKRHVAYAIANYDHMVGWGKYLIHRQRELPKSNILLKDEKYLHIVYVEPDR